MNKYKLTIEYDGTNYHGWQAQQNAKTIQGVLVSAAKKLMTGKIEIQGAGRTDAGVHALGQVAHLGCDLKFSPRQLLAGLNDLLPANINILHVEEAPEDFHARHAATMRSYLYIISKRRTALGKKYVWWIKDPLNVEKMERAFAIFRGFHDFSSFADKRIDKSASTLVKLDLLELHQTGQMLIFRIAGSHFLWKMVRRLVGVLVEVGRGTLTMPEVEKMLAEPSSQPARYTAPPSGLFLEQVLYPGDKLKPLRLPVHVL